MRSGKLGEIGIIAGAVVVVVLAAYSLTRSWLAVALVFGSGLGLGAVWLIVRAMHAIVKE